MKRKLTIWIITAAVVLSSAFLIAQTVEKGYIGKQDFSLWDGTATKTFTRQTSEGYDLTLNKVDWPGVDVLQVYGGGVARTHAAIAYAVSATSSTLTPLWLSPGTWTIGANTTFAALSVPVIPPGATLSVSSGFTLTFSGTKIQAGPYQIFSGAGDFNFADETELRLSWFASLSAAIGYIGANNVKIIVDRSDSVSADVTVPANVSLVFTNGAILTVATTKTLTINGVLDAPRTAKLFTLTGTGAVAFGSKVPGAFPQWFGAVGDDSTDDSTAIQAALNASLNFFGGGPANTYKITSTLDLRAGHTLKFDMATVKQYTDQTPMFDVTGLANVTITGGNFYGKGTDFQNNSSSQAIGIDCDNAENLVVTGNTFRNFGFAGLFSNVGLVGLTFADNTVIGPGVAVLSDPDYRNCMGLVATGSNIVIANNRISETAQGVYIGQGSTKVTVAGNIVFDIINEHGMYCDTSIIDLTIIGNTIRNTGKIGIKVQWYDDAVTFTSEPASITISGNSIFGCGTDGILVWNDNPGAGTAFYGRGITISGNTIRIAGQDGISVRYGSGGSITGNTIYTAVRYGIALTNCEDFVISGNLTKLTDYHGILLIHDGVNADGCRNISVIGNNVYLPGELGDGDVVNCCGIYVASGSDINIANNFVTGDPTKMIYGLYILGGTQTSMVVRGNTVTGAKYTGAKFKSPAEPMRYFGENYFEGAYGKNIGTLIPEVGQRGTTENIHFSAAVPATGTWTSGAIIFKRTPAAGGEPGWICTTSGTFSAATDATGDTTSGSPIIAGMTDTSDFLTGEYVTVSAGFATTGPYLILEKTATSITININSNATQSDITVSTPDPVFKAMANIGA